MKIVSLFKAAVQRVWQRFDKPVPALPVDLFRIGAGLLSAAYFWRLYREVGTISSSDGLIDHKLLRKIFPYTRMGLFPLESSDRFLSAVHLTAVAASLTVAAGVGIRPNTLFLYATAVSSYRRNFITVYVDDGIMHLVLFWLLLLPTGHTLTLNKQNRQPWQTATVPGFTVRAFLANLSLIYFVAGLWKWDSPLWRQGLGAYVALKMPISYAPQFWSPRIQPLLAPISHFVLIGEPILATLPLLPSHSPLKYGVGGTLLAFHTGIIGTLRVPYANVACIAALPLLFRDELMQWLAPSAQPDDPIMAQTPTVQKVLATILLILLILANIWRINERHPASKEGNPRDAEIRAYRNPWHGLLWVMGMAQSYRLMDWIDKLNWHVYYEGQELIAGTCHPFNPDRVFPKSARHVFLQSYIQNRSWRIPPSYLTELQISLLTRYVRQFARQTPNTGHITIYTNIGRITGDNIDLHDMQRFKLLQFSVQDGVPTIDFMHLSTK